MKRFAFCMLLLALGVHVSVARGFEAAAVEDVLEQEAASQVCCLPVLEHTTKGNFGYCYLSKDGYLQARIDDKQLRDHANLYPQSYPVCKDKWCTFDKGPEALRYYRMNNQGFVLQLGDKKFEKDHVGLLQDAPAQHVASYGLEWIGEQVPACKVDVDVNAELLGPLCVMKKAGEHELAFVEAAEVGGSLGAMARGDDSYSLFYKTEGSVAAVTGKMPNKYLRALFDSKVNVRVGACPQGSERDFSQLGYKVAK